MSGHVKIGGEKLKLRLHFGGLEKLELKYDMPFEEIMQKPSMTKVLDVIEVGLEGGGNAKDRDWLRENMDFAEVEQYAQAIASALPPAHKEQIERAKAKLEGNPTGNRNEPTTKS